MQNILTVEFRYSKVSSRLTVTWIGQETFLVVLPVTLCCSVSRSSSRASGLRPAATSGSTVLAEGIIPRGGLSGTYMPSCLRTDVVASVLTTHSWKPVSSCHGLQPTKLLASQRLVIRFISSMQQDNLRGQSHTMERSTTCCMQAIALPHLFGQIHTAQKAVPPCAS